MLRATGNFVCLSTIDQLSNNSIKSIKLAVLARLSCYFNVPIDILLLSDIQADKQTVAELARLAALKRTQSLDSY